MTAGSNDQQHAALWLVGSDMPGLLNIGARFVAEHRGNIDKDIAVKFGEKAVVFLSITAHPDDIARMAKDNGHLKESSGCAVVFQPMKESTVPEGYQPELHGFDIITDDAIGVVADVTQLLNEFDMLVVGHTGERRVVPGPRHRTQGGQKYVVNLPFDFDHAKFNYALTQLVKKYNGQMKTPLRAVPGLLWVW